MKFRNDSEEPGLNAPFGARCFLTAGFDLVMCIAARLNAPFGARCFLTIISSSQATFRSRLNAPFGARRFLTQATDPKADQSAKS